MFAQSGSPDFFAGLRFIMRPEFSRYLLLFAGLLALLVVSAIIAAVARRSRGTLSRQRNILAFDNLDVMKKRGLLTPEEIQKVRQAMARQLMEADKQAPEATVETLEAEALRTALEASLREKVDEASEATEEGEKKTKIGG